MPEYNPYLAETIMEVVDNQMRQNDPPTTKLTYDRLIGQGIAPDEVKRMLGSVVVSEVFDMMNKGEEFDLIRFTAALDRLPDTREE